MKVKPDRKKLEKELDKLFSQAVISREGKCKHSMMDVVVDLFDCRGREDE